MTRGRVSVIRDPAIASAAAKCWLARWHKGSGARTIGIPITSFHPQDCGFCEYPTDKLIESVDEFVKKIKSLGGQIAVEKRAVPTMGYFAVALDPQHNAIAVWETDATAK